MPKLSPRGDRMRILIYKRTHIGDPDQNGRFGIYDCMGRVRDYAFDAVIGVGGIGREAKSFGIDRKINWVGTKATKHRNPDGTNAEVTFENFLIMEDEGPQLASLAPALAKRMYQVGARFLLNDYTAAERREATAILEWSLHQKSSTVSDTKVTLGCQSRCRSTAACKPSG